MAEGFKMDKIVDKTLRKLKEVKRFDGVFVVTVATQKGEYVKELVRYISFSRERASSSWRRTFSLMVCMSEN